MELSDLEKKVLAEISKRNVGYIPRTSEITALFNLNERGLVRAVVDPRFGQIWHITDTGKVVLRQNQVLQEYETPDDDVNWYSEALKSVEKRDRRIDELETALGNLIDISNNISDYLSGEKVNDAFIIEIQQAEKVLENKNPPN